MALDPARLPILAGGLGRETNTRSPLVPLARALPCCCARKAGVVTIDDMAGVSLVVDPVEVPDCFTLPSFFLAELKDLAASLGVRRRKGRSASVFREGARETCASPGG